MLLNTVLCKIWSLKNNVCLINKQIHSMKHKLTLVILSFFLGGQCMVAFQQMKVTGVVIKWKMMGSLLQVQCIHCSKEPLLEIH